MSKSFELISDISPKGDQPAAIKELVRGVESGKREQVLLGVTGSGKTFTVANVIEQVKKPTLIIAHNKTLAAQLYGELLELFPHNGVHYFVSYYDYYQPEAYIPETDTFIEKDASINEHIDRMRHAATSSLFERRDIIIVASVSAIYGIGAPEDYFGMLTIVEVGKHLTRDTLTKNLTAVQYLRTNSSLTRGSYRVRGDVVEVFPSHQEKVALRIEFFGDEVDSIKEFDPGSGRSIKSISRCIIYPGTHYVAPEDKMEAAIEGIKKELEHHQAYLKREGMELERKRLRERTNYDIELLETMGFCPGIENYSRHISGRRPGEPPWTIINYFPDDMLFIIDESHQTVPQIRGMYIGDRSRKLTLVENGFRLPSALDNRPLNFEEFKERVTQVIYVSATPGPHELDSTGGEIVEQIIRPTGLADPEVELRPAENQVDDLLDEIREVIGRGDRVLVTTLTKRMAEDLTEYYRELGLAIRYLHSDIDTLERIRIVRDLRLGKFDVLVGINLLREGLDIPEVALVAVMDADKEGYLRSETSLIQVFGRAARHREGRVILYADRVTSSMRSAMEETTRRREIQEHYNRENNITPRSIEKGISDILTNIYEADYLTVPKDSEDQMYKIPPEKIPSTILSLTNEMQEQANNLDFEDAARTRNKIKRLREIEAEYMSEEK